MNPVVVGEEDSPSDSQASLTSENPNPQLLLIQREAARVVAFASVRPAWDFEPSPLRPILGPQLAAASLGVALAADSMSSESSDPSPAAPLLKQVAPPAAQPPAQASGGGGSGAASGGAAPNGRSAAATTPMGSTSVAQPELGAPSFAEMNAAPGPTGGPHQDDGGYDAIALLAGDYNGDGAVDAADYTVWRDSYGMVGDNPADGDLSTVIDEPDYGIWAANYGATLPKIEIASVFAGANLFSIGDSYMAPSSGFGQVFQAIAAGIPVEFGGAVGMMRSGYGLHQLMTRVYPGVQVPLAPGDAYPYYPELVNDYPVELGVHHWTTDVPNGHVIGGLAALDPAKVPVIEPANDFSLAGDPWTWSMLINSLPTNNAGVSSGPTWGVFRPYSVSTIRFSHYEEDFVWSPKPNGEAIQTADPWLLLSAGGNVDETGKDLFMKMWAYQKTDATENRLVVQDVIAKGGWTTDQALAITTEQYRAIYEDYARLGLPTNLIVDGLGINPGETQGGFSNTDIGTFKEDKRTLIERTMGAAQEFSEEPVTYVMLGAIPWRHTDGTDMTPRTRLLAEAMQELADELGPNVIFADVGRHFTEQNGPLAEWQSTMLQGHNGGWLHFRQTATALTAWGDAIEAGIYEGQLRKLQLADSPA